MQNVSEIFYRVIGIVILAAAIAVFNTSSNSVTQRLSIVKENQTRDGVYEEATLSETDETKVSRNELKAMLVAGPNRNVTIVDNGYTIKVHAGENVNAYVTIKYGTNKETIYFGKDRWDPFELDLDEWLTSPFYESIPIKYSSGRVRRFFYKGVSV